MDVKKNLAIRNNHLVRGCLLPFINILKKYRYIKYQGSYDSNYIRKLKNTMTGKRCFIIGNGPSLEPEDLELLKCEKCFAFNRIFDIYNYTKWRPTYYMCTDRAIIKNTLPHEIEKCIGSEIVFIYDKEIVEKNRSKMNIHQIILHGKTPVKREKLVLREIKEDVSRCFSPCQSVTITAFELAFFMGFSEIYLLGLDHFFGVEVDMKGNKIINQDVQPHFKETKDKKIYNSNKEALTLSYEKCKEFGEKHGVRIVNVTRGGMLEVFSRRSLEEIVK